MDNMTVMTGDVLDIHNEFSSYQEFKQTLDENFLAAEERFVIIGYMLKAARDTDILKESGYRNMWEFAKAEYSLDKSQTSRFIRINDRFSENGYSKRLDERYRRFGNAKLAIMLTLPDEINGELSSGYSKAEIQTIKEEIDEERKTSDLEVMLEEKDGRQQAYSDFGKVLHQLGMDKPKMYLGMYEAVCETMYDGTNRPVVGKLIDVLAPAGEAFISVRIAGEGRKMLSIKGADREPVLVDVRSGEKQSCTWDQMITEIETLSPEAEDARKAWETLYGEPFPENEAEVAPVQPEKSQGTRKVSKVTKAKTPEKTRTETAQEETGNAYGQQEEKRQEAAGGDNEESRENETQEAACADSEPAGEPAAGSEPADKASGAAGGAGEDSTGGSADGEGGAGTAPVPPDAGQIERQMDITKYPEYMPDAEGGVQESPPAAAGGTEEPEKPEMTRTEAEAAAGTEDPGGTIRDEDGGVALYVENQKREIIRRLCHAESLCGSGEWDGLIREMGDIVTLAEAVRNMEEMWNG